MFYDYRITDGEAATSFLTSGENPLLDDYFALATQGKDSRSSTLTNMATTLSCDLLINLSYFSIRGFVCRPLVCAFRIISALAALFTGHFEMAKKQVQLAGISFGRIFLTPIQLIYTVVAAFKIFVPANSSVEKKFYSLLCFAHAIDGFFDEKEESLFEGERGEGQLLQAADRIEPSAASARTEADAARASATKFTDVHKEELGKTKNWGEVKSLADSWVAKNPAAQKDPEFMASVKVYAKFTLGIEGVPK